MEELIGSRSLELNHLQVIMRGMYAVAKSDGIHESELVLMRDFYKSCRVDAGGLAEFDDIIGQPFNGAEAKEILNDDELVNIFFTSCWLLAFADGQITDKEKGMIADLGKQLGVGDDKISSTYEQVKDFLLAHISNIQNLDALKEVMEEMG